MVSFARELDKGVMGPAVQAVAKMDLSASFKPAQKISHDGQRYAPNIGQAAKSAHSGIADAKLKLGSIEDARKEMRGAQENKEPQADPGKGFSLTGVALSEGMGWAATVAAYAVNPGLGLAVGAGTTLNTVVNLMGNRADRTASWDEMHPGEYMSDAKSGEVYQRYDTPSKDVTQQANFQQQPSIPQPMRMGDMEGPSYEDSMAEVFGFFDNNPSVAQDMLPTEEDLQRAEDGLTAQMAEQERSLAAVHNFVYEYKPLAPAAVPTPPV